MQPKVHWCEAGCISKHFQLKKNKRVIYDHDVIFK